MNVRSRLEARQFGSSKVTIEDLEWELKQRFEKADKKRLEHQMLRSEKAQKLVLRVHETVREHSILQEEIRREKEEKMLSRQIKAENKRRQYRQAKLVVSKRQSELANIALDRRRTQALTTKLSIESSVKEAEKRREKHFKDMVDRLVSHLKRVESNKMRVGAVRYIQKWYRDHVEVHRAWRSLSTSSANDVKQISNLFLQLKAANFEEAMDLLQDKKYSAMAKCFLNCLPLTSAMESRPERMRTSRVFLMAGMISDHAENVLVDDDNQENVSPEARKAQKLLADSLQWASKQVVKSMLELAGILAQLDVSHDLIRSMLVKFDATRVAYIDCFNGWKRMDGERLAGDLVQSYAQLYAANFATSLEHGDNTKEDRVHEIIYRTKQQMQQLHGAIYKVLGKDATDARLRQLRSNIEQQVTAKYRKSEKKEKQQQEIQAARELKQARRQEKAAREPDLGFTRSVFSNDQLAHELILDPMYKLERNPREDEPAASLVQRVQVSMKKAYWEQLVAIVQAGGPTANERIQNQLEEIRDALVSVLGSTNDATEVSNVLNSESLMTSLAHGLSWVWLWDTFKFILQKIVVNEAPARTEDTNAWIVRLQATNGDGIEAQVLPDLCQFIFEKIDLLRLDSVNAHLRILAPYLRRHGVEHERSKLDEKLAQNPRSLDNTRRWIYSIMEVYYGKVDPSERQRLHQSNGDAFSLFLVETFMSLIETHIEGKDPSLWPESFSMDIDRIRQMRDVVDMIALRASFVAIVRQNLSKPLVNISYTDIQAAAFSEKVHCLLSDPTIKLPDLSAQVVEEVRTLVEKAGKDFTKDEATVLLTQVGSIMQAENPIFRLFFTRTISHIGQMLSAKKGLQNSTEHTVPAGLHYFETELEGVVEKGYRLYSHNHAVHAAHYNVIIQECLSARNDVNID